MQSQSDTGDLKREIYRYLHHWRWFLVSLLIFLLFAFIHLRYTTPEYAARTSIRLIQDKGTSPVAALLGDAGLVTGGDKLITDELQIIKSPALMEEVVQDLGLHFQIYSEGRVTNKELYGNKPVRINFLFSDSLYRNSQLYFEITPLNSAQFRFTDEYGREADYRYGENVPLETGSLIVTPVRGLTERYYDNDLLCVLSPVENVAFSILDRLTVSTSNDRVNRSNIITLTVTDPVPAKAERILGKLVELYNKNTVDQKSQVAKVTFEFINDRINLISRDLNDVDRTKERFKVGNRVTDITSEAGIFLQAGAANEQELIKVETELNTVNYMIGYLGKQQSFEMLPVNVGLNDPSLANLTQQYNELVLERQRLLRSSGEKNPIVIQLDERLNGLRMAIRQSLTNIRSALNIRAGNLRSQDSQLAARIAAVPGQERENRDIQRQQNIKEQIYLYLLQKREESAIAMATTTPNSEIIDRARANSKQPVSPKPKIVLLAASILGMILPFGFLYLKNLLDTKVYNKSDVQRMGSSLPVLAELPLEEDAAGDGVNFEERSMLGESFRSLRNHLDLIPGVEQSKSKSIFVTSSINGEGKSFVAFNLAATFAYAGKRVLLLGTDIRKPALNGFVKGDREQGLTDYLRGELDIETLVSRVGTSENFDVLQSGNPVSNPNELLLSSRMALLFQWARSHYEVIVVDTAPCLLVSDTLLFAQHSDVSLYVIRSGYTEKEMVGFIEEIAQGQRLPNMQIVINAVKPEDLHYSGSYYRYYGYGNKSPKGIWQQFKTRVKKYLGVANFRYWSS